MNPVIEVIKLFYAQLSMKFIMHIKVKMPTIVGILTFMSMINTTSEKGSSVVVCLTRDQGAAGSSLTSVTALCP